MTITIANRVIPSQIKSVKTTTMISTILATAYILQQFHSTNAFNSNAFNPAFSRATKTRLFEQVQSQTSSQQNFGFAQPLPEEAVKPTSRPTSLSAFALDTFDNDVATSFDESFNIKEILSFPRNKALESIVQVLSAALLITSNTVGAGCLVLPELAMQGPGMLATTGIFVTAFIINLISGLVIAQIAITQKEEGGTDTPSSFKEFARVNLNSDSAAIFVSSISLFVNACVLSFDLNRVGTIGSNLLPISSDMMSIAWATGVFSLISTQSSQKLSQISNFLVMALFLSFGGLLIPGLANVADPVTTMLTPGLSDNLWSSVGYTAPIILMAMIFQNIVPTVTKLLNYDRVKTVASLVIGSSIPLLLYLSWIFACLGGGIDTSVLLGGGDSMTSLSVSSALLTVFSLVTIGGSSMCGGVSVAEELETFLSDHKSSNQSPEGEIDRTAIAPAFQLPSAIISLAVPLGAALLFAGGSEGEGLTDALALAGSFGSPLLYGAIPAYIAYQQLNNRDEKSESRGQDGVVLGISDKTRNFLVPAFSLPVLGALSLGYVGQEMIQRITQVLPFTS